MADDRVREAKRRNANRPAAVYDFVSDLLLKRASYISEAARDEHMRFVGKFQQVTSPVTAKGIEDTAFYHYNRLVSLNEVGGEPDVFGTSASRLHAWLKRRAERWPHALSATSTHDTKRGEDRLINRRGSGAQPEKVSKRDFLFLILQKK